MPCRIRYQVMTSWENQTASQILSRSFEPQTDRCKYISTVLEYPSEEKDGEAIFIDSVGVFELFLSVFSPPLPLFVCSCPNLPPLECLLYVSNHDGLS